MLLFVTRQPLAAAIGIWALLAAGACGSTGWPASSIRAPALLGFPTIEDRVAGLSPPPDQGFSFAVFGDQRALADGEWQEMMRQIGERGRADDRLLFMVDTGDIVKDGRHTDQFWRLREILAPAGRLPYLVGIGNHEVHNNQDDRARDHTSRFLGYLDERLAPERLYFVKKIGPVRFLFLDTNDLVYGDNGEQRSFARASAQMTWLTNELARRDDSIKTTVAVMHHPMVLSSTKHQAHARRLWNERHDAGRLPEILTDGGVEIVLTGHTHTYERFTLTRGTAPPMHVINVSGRPRGFFTGSRRARNIEGREREILEDRGWNALDEWSVRQVDAMSADEEANQFAVLSVEADGGVLLDLFFLDPSATNGLRVVPTARLK